MVTDSCEPVTDIEEVATGDERIMPHSIELEQSVLGAMMLSRAAVSKCAALIDRQVFYRGRHREIFDGIVRLYEAKKPADLSLIAEDLEKRGVLAECGGPAYLADVAAAVGTSANVEHHARSLIEKAARRRTITLSTRLAAVCYDGTGDYYVTMDSYQRELLSLTERRWERGFRPIGRGVDTAFGKLEDAAKYGRSIGIASGYQWLDAKTGGYQPGELILVAARPGVGKTTFALNCAHRIAVEAGIPVGIVSLEMTEEELALRLMCIDARIDSLKAKRGALSGDEWTRMAASADRIKASPIHIDDAGRITPLEIAARAQRLQAEHGMRLLIVDYIQIMHLPYRVDRRDLEIAAFSGGLKALAKDLRVPVIACAQITRDFEKRSAMRPMLSDLRESGALEQDSDVVIFVHRPEAHGITKDPETGESTEGKARLYIEKQRNGPTGIVDLLWIGRHTRFESVAPDGVVEPAEASHDDGPF